MLYLDMNRHQSVGRQTKPHVHLLARSPFLSLPRSTFPPSSSRNIFDFSISPISLARSSYSLSFSQRVLPWIPRMEMSSLPPLPGLLLSTP